MKLAQRLLVAWIVLSCAAPLRASVGKTAARRSYDYALELFEKGDFKQALTEINNTITDNPGLTIAYALRARLWNVFGDVPNMQKDCDKTLDRLGASLSSLNIEELIAQGSAYLLKGQTQRAMSSFEAALQLNSDNAEALAGRARVLRAEGLNDRALDDLNQLMGMEKPAPLNLYSRANVYYDLGQFDNALADLTAALRQYKSFYPAYGLVGATLARKGDFKRALKAYGKALAINPDYSFAYLGMAAIHLNQGVEDSAFEDFDNAIRVDPHDYAPYFNRAEAFWRRGNRDEALADYRKALDAVSLEPEYAIKIGDRLSQLVLLREAVRAYTRAYSLAGRTIARRR